MKGNLLARVERLETQQQQGIAARSHRIIQHIGETAAMARGRYEREAGLEIDPADLVILRVIVGPSEGMAA